MYKIYWIKYPEHTDPFSDGYIGLTSQDLDKRFNEHKHNNKNKHLKNRCRKEKVEIKCLLENLSQEEAKKIEEIYRPNENIGWNINKGGTKPPSKLGWKPSEETLRKRSTSLKGIPRTDAWKKRLSDAKKGEGNGMYGKKIPCTDERKLSIIVAKYKNREENLKLALDLLENSNHRIREISKLTGISTSVICKIKKETELYNLALPIIIQSKAS